MRANWCLSNPATVTATVSDNKVCSAVKNTAVFQIGRRCIADCYRTRTTDFDRVGTSANHLVVVEGYISNATANQMNRLIVAVNLNLTTRIIKSVASISPQEFCHTSFLSYPLFIYLFPVRKL